MKEKKKKETRNMGTIKHSRQRWRGGHDMHVERRRSADDQVNVESVGATLAGASCLSVENRLHSNAVFGT